MLTYELAGCPACQATASRVVANRDQLLEETEERWRFQLARRRPGVPTMQLYDRAFFTQPAPLHLVECLECGTLYRNPRETADSLQNAYAGEDTNTTVLQALFETQQRHLQRQADRLTRLAGKAGHGLEVGSYVGAFLAAARVHGWRFEGVDINEQACCFARRQGFTVWPGTLYDLPSDQRYDAIAFWNCLDQLADPAHALRVAHERLNNGGWLAVRVPNGACYRRWHRSTRAKPLARHILAYNNLLGFPYRQGFTPSSLARLLEHTGFCVQAAFGEVLVPLSDRWTRRWAVWEEKFAKRLLRASRKRHAPWIELYALRK